MPNNHATTSGRRVFRNPAISLCFLLFKGCCIFASVSAYPQAFDSSRIEQITIGSGRRSNWKDLRDREITKQKHDFSCGAASISTLLTHFYLDNVSEHEVLRIMGEKNNESATMLSMAMALEQLGYDTLALNLSYSQLMELQVPAIAFLSRKSNGHFTVVKGVGATSVALADSSMGNVSMSRERFLEMWRNNDGSTEGKIMLAKPKSSSFKIASKFFTENPERHSDFVHNNLSTSGSIQRR